MENPLDCSRGRGLGITDRGFCDGIEERSNKQHTSAVEGDLGSLRSSGSSRSQNGEFIAREQSSDVES